MEVSVAMQMVTVKSGIWIIGGNASFSSRDRHVGISAGMTVCVVEAGVLRSCQGLVQNGEFDHVNGKLNSQTKRKVSCF